jgi:hypothetical protein
VAKVSVYATVTDEEACARHLRYRRPVPFHDACTVSAERTRQFATVKELLTAVEFGTS